LDTGISMMKNRESSEVDEFKELCDDISVRRADLLRSDHEKKQKKIQASIHPFLMKKKSSRDGER
jgi:hypothetical protein